LRAAAEECDVPLITWGSLAQGLLTGKYDATTVFRGDDRRSRYENFQGSKFEANLQMLSQLKVISQRLGHTPGQVALRWLLDTSRVACTLFGAKRPSQVDENAGALGWRLPSDDYHLLDTTPTTAVPCAA
jgi:aryl-alcohol dehydrogenase-like predicted oxidoreductase